MTDDDAQLDQELAAKIAALDVIEPPPGWIDRAVERWQRTQATIAPRRQRRWPWAAAAGAALAIAAAAIIIPRCRHDRVDELVVAVEGHTPPTRGGAHSVGDVLTARARIHAQHVELRVYRDNALIVRCPDDARCTKDHGTVAVALTIDRPGSYQIVVVSSSTPLPAPAANLELDLLQARSSGAHLATRPPIDVR